MNETPIGNIKNVVINRDKLLNIIKENKAKHDALFEMSVSGYWLTADTRIQEKKNEFEKYLIDAALDFRRNAENIHEKIKNKQKVDNVSYIPMQTSMSYQINLSYPVSYTNEYHKAIRSVELSVYDNIQLNEQEFNQNVLNDWNWKSSFVNSNSAYVTNCLTGYSPILFSGSSYYNAIAMSGCLIL